MDQRAVSGPRSSWVFLFRIMGGIELSTFIDIYRETENSKLSSEKCVLSGSSLFSSEFLVFGLRAHFILERL